MLRIVQCHDKIILMLVSLASLVVSELRKKIQWMEQQDLEMKHSKMFPSAKLPDELKYSVEEI